MIKIVALFLVATVFILTGQYANRRMKKRIISLKQLIVLIENISSQISFSKRTIQEIICDLSSAEELKLKTMCELSRNDSDDFSGNWRESVTEFSSDDCLDKDDEKILLSFGKILGVTDSEGQVSNCRLHISMLEKQLKTAEENLREKSRVNTALCSFLALAVVIIFY